MTTLEQKLNKVLGIKEEKDAPVPYKPEGNQQKSGEGAHRFDKPTEFVQMKPDNRFMTKSQQKQLH